MKYQILKLRDEGKTYQEIKDILGCSKSTISYHCGEGQKTKNDQRRVKRRAKQHPFERKLETYINRKYLNYTPPPHKHNNHKCLYMKVFLFTGGNMSKATFTVDDVIKKFGTNPTCYLTGEPIDINKPRTYHFDHIIPKARGGDNSLDNLGIVTKQANESKRDMTPDEYVNLCKRVLEHQGYNVTK